MQCFVVSQGRGETSPLGLVRGGESRLGHLECGPQETGKPPVGKEEGGAPLHRRQWSWSTLVRGATRWGIENEGHDYSSPLGLCTHLGSTVKATAWPGTPDVPDRPDLCTSD